MNKNVQELYSFPHKILLFPKYCKLQYTTKSSSNSQYVYKSVFNMNKYNSEYVNKY